MFITTFGESLAFVSLLFPGSSLLIAFMLRTSGPTPVAVPDTQPTDPGLLAARRRRGRLMLRMPIAPEGVAELVRLGWLHRSYCHNPAFVADAVILSVLDRLPHHESERQHCR
jgi:hypothetical protein